MILDITSFISVQSWGLRRSTEVEIPTTGAGASHSPRHHSFRVGLLQCVHFMNSFALRYRGVPFFTAEKPLIFKAARAFFTAMIQGLALPKALLFLIRSFAVMPPTVFALLPRSTITLAMRPFAILLTVFFFMAFMAFIAFIAFIAFAIAGRSLEFTRCTIQLSL